MYRYKRGINDIENLDKASFIISNNDDALTSLTCNFCAKRLYDGLYIKKNNVIIENVVEEIELKNTVYKMANLNTSTFSISDNEYIENVNMDNNEINYKIGNISYLKKLAYYEDILIIKYEVENNEESNIRFKISPLVTYRNIKSAKNSSFLRFNQRSTKNEVVINLSVHQNENLYIKSDKLEYGKDVEYINNVKHTDITKKMVKEVKIEDLFIPGTFEITINKGQKQAFYVLISTKEINLENSKIEEKINLYFENRENETKKIPEEYVELRDLASLVGQFNLKNMDICTYPYLVDIDDIYNMDEITIEALLKYINILTDYTKSIEGRFVTLNKNKEAISVINYVRNIIEDIEKLDIKYDSFKFAFLKLKLWYIEILNKIIGENNLLIQDDEYVFIKEIIKESLTNKNMLLQNIESAALLFNAIKILRHILNKEGIDNNELYGEEIFIKSLVEKEFYDENKKCLKENLNDKEAKTNISMIYTLSLSYPCIVGEKSIKILDTIFKELYTPYGLRKISKKDEKYDGMIYPKYLAHFIKANLRQNGITRASKKIAYNLVRELILDISKKISGGIPKIYNEKGVIIDDISVDLLTNAEVIRLYDMLT